jgi:hypothetical protein
LTELTRPELFELALGIAGGAVFTDQHIDNTNGEGAQVMCHVFMPLLHIDIGSLDALLDEAGLIYEWGSRAFSEVDGYPSFTSMQWLNHAEAEWVWEQVGQILELGPSEEGDSNAEPDAS